MIRNNQPLQMFHEASHFISRQHHMCLGLARPGFEQLTFRARSTNCVRPTAAAFVVVVTMNNNNYRSSNNNKSKINLIYLMFIFKIKYVFTTNHIHIRLKKMKITPPPLPRTLKNDASCLLYQQILVPIDAHHFLIT